MNSINEYSIALLKLESKINELNNTLLQLKEQKKKLEQRLILNLESNNTNLIKIGKYKIKLAAETNYTPLTYKFVEANLNLMFPNNGEKVNQIIKFIKSNREKQINKCLKIG